MITRALRDHDATVWPPASSDMVPLRVLLVEDDSEDRVLACRALARMASFACDVRWAPSGVAAAAALRGGDLDLVVLDQHLGAHTGLELLVDVFGGRPGLPVVLLTDDADADTDLQASSAGAVVLLEKADLTPRALERSIRYALAQWRAEREIRSARAFFHAGFDALHDHVAVLDIEGTIVDVSPAWERFARENGSTHPDAWRGVNYLAVCDAATGEHAEAAADAARGIRAVLAGEQPNFRLEYPCHAPHVQRWFVLRAVRFDDAGRPLLYVTHHDTTERRQAEDARRASEDRYRRLVDTSHDGICTVDATGVITYANGRLAEMLGYEHTELAGRLLFDLMSPDEAFSARTRFARRQRGFSDVEELSFRRKDGATLWVREAASPILGTDGIFVGAMYVLGDFTERRRAEEALRGSETRYRLLFERNPMPMLVVDSGSRRFLAVNDAAVATYGYSREELLSMRLDDLRLAAERPALVEQFTTTSGFLRVGVRQHVCKDGSIIDADILWDTASFGDRPARLVMAKNVTEQRRAEAALRSAHETMTTLVNASPLAIVTVDDCGIVTMWNAAAERIFGWSAAEAIGRDYPLLPAEDLPDFHRRLREQLAAGTVSTGVETQRLRSDGTLVPVSLATATMWQPDGRALGIAFLTDITERRNADAALNETRRQMELLLASAGEGIFAVDASGLATFVNPAAARLLSAAPEDLVGQDMHALIHHTCPDGSAYHEDHCPINASIRDGTVHRVDTELFWREDGTSFPVEYVSTPLREDGHIVGAAVAFQDITQRRQLELQLRQGQKMEAIGRLAGGVAHDFNNLLTVITGYAAMLLAELPGDDPMLPDLREIQAASARAAGLTRQLLAFSRQQVLEPRVIDLQLVVANMENMLRRLIGEDVELSITSSSMLAHVHADPGQVEQIVMNLVVNARDAMPAGGQLTIDVREAALTADDAARFPYVTPGQYVRLSVRDTGAGMDELTQTQMFEPFFTTKPVGEGTGLGLATVYGIVKQSGGYIWVDSAPGEGATFRIYLPRVVDELTATIAGAPTAIVPARTGATVLLAEDDDRLRAVIDRILTKRGYTVLAACSGADALAIAERHEGAIDLVVTDVVMPKMSGQELAERFVVRHGDVPILFLSGHSVEAVANHGVLRGGSQLLKKPFMPQELAFAVSELLRLHCGLAHTGEHPAIDDEGTP